MSIGILQDLWLCSDCTIVAANGDVSGIQDDARVVQVCQGLDRLGSGLACGSETNEFYRRNCDCCREDICGYAQRFHILGEVQS